MSDGETDMSERANFSTPQEAFWAGEFGDDYVSRNSGDRVVASNRQLFATALGSVGPISSCLEFGANIGLNLQALRLLHPTLALKAVEINPRAAAILGQLIGPENVVVGSIGAYSSSETFDLVLVKGVLIHLQPETLPVVYEKMYRASHRLILVAEYYNPTPVAVPYRGHADRLFKRDFAGELLDRYPDLTLLNYGFAYHRDVMFPQDDITWFLLEKQSISCR